MQVLPATLFGHRGMRHRPALILAFARQELDARTRLASPHWTSARGRNVGQDVQDACTVSLDILVACLKADEANPFECAISRIDAHKATLRSEHADTDGYGLGTLGEIQRALLDITNNADVPLAG